MNHENAQDQQVTERVPEDIYRMLKNYKEAVVIVVDDKHDPEGESTTVAFMKLLDENGTMASVLATVLENLLATSHAKKRGGITAEATIGA